MSVKNGKVYHVQIIQKTKNNSRQIVIFKNCTFNKCFLYYQFPLQILISLKVKSVETLDIGCICIQSKTPLFPATN